ncbi:OadG family protein [uncultured Cetobacterium sp.]|uniref:OadG family protein n=1 Tax=uncultured Cetobacterium sp. TaxID=527638 RepID=UPI00261D425F|nr:OadG family protein [uncultured Cetobacterium sp.]
MFKGQISLITSLEITLISMLVVFVILAILAFVLSLFKYVPAEKVVADIKKAQKSADIPKEVQRERFDPSKITSEDMKIAMMVACIEAAGEEENANVRVIGIKELN